VGPAGRPSPRDYGQLDGSETAGNSDISPYLSQPLVSKRRAFRKDLERGDLEFYFGKWRTPAAIRAHDRRSRRHFPCLDCQYDTFRDEYYMLRNEVWLSANPKSKGMLCIGCVEERIGRRLTPEDFSAAPINHESEGFFFTPKSARLLSRLAPP
jgi:hypothetical protein